MFRSYDHLQFQINSTDNRSVVFRTFVNLIHYGDRFLMAVTVVTVGELTIGCCCRSLVLLLLALSMFLARGVSWITLTRRLWLRAVLPIVSHRG
jgi:hypothetical protein